MAVEPSLVAILPCRDLDRSEAFYARLGFIRGPGQEAWQDDYRLLATAEGVELHLRRAEDGWVVPERNPFGLYLRTAAVEDLAARFPGEILGAGVPAETDWRTFEFALSDPDGALVRVGRVLKDRP